MSFFRAVLAGLFYQSCFSGFCVRAAVLGERQALPSSLSSSSCMSFPKAFSAPTWNSLLITSDTNASVTSVTKVVAITTYAMNPSGTTPSSDTSVVDGVITKVVRVGPTTVNTASCNPLLCSVNVAVSDSHPLQKLERALSPDPVCLGVLLAPRVRKNSVSIHNFQSAFSAASSRVDPVSSFPSSLQ